MSFPQHYGIATAALDFTKKSLVAIYFSIESHLNIIFENKSGLYIAGNTVNYDDFLSIYAILFSDSHNSPIKIEEIDYSLPNPRAKNQEGALCYFSKPCSYYMEYNRFPAIENYLINGKSKYFILKKLSLRRNMTNLDSLAEILRKENINKNLIYPDLIV